jgi:uncharacterized protein (DUF58 family)
MRARKIDFARLNYILIPKTKADRDRFRRSRFGRMLMPLAGLFGSLTEEGGTLMIVTIIVGAFALDVQRSSAYALFCALAGIVVGSLVAARRLSLAGVRVSVNAPKRITVGEAATFSVSCARAPARGEAFPPIRVRGPFLPWDGRWVDRAADELVVTSGRSASVLTRARFIARGVHHLDPFTAASVAPLGLACGPRVESEAAKITVIPRIAKVTRLPLEIATRHQPGGVALASKSGESMDLLGVRPYRPGDPVRDLHARTWARTGAPVVREYQQEYFTRVGVVLDTSTDDPAVLEAAIELAAGVLANLSRGETLVDVLVVGDRVHELTLGRSLGYLDQALDLLATVEQGPPLRASELSRRLEPYLARLSSVVVIAVAGEGRAEGSVVERGIRDRGVACTTLEVDDKLVAAIRSGEELAW